jgi:Ni,Fe-hydrogenase III small subunit
MFPLLRKILRTGRVAEPAPTRPAALSCPQAARLRGSVQLRHVDAGSCNGCEIEIGSAFGPVYDAEALLVTGPVTHNMAGALQRTYDTVSEPRIVVAVGDCARNAGVFAGGYGVVGAVSDVVPVDVEVPGCPPSPDAIVAALRGLTGR